MASTQDDMIAELQPAHSTLAMSKPVDVQRLMQERAAIAEGLTGDDA